MRHRTHLAPLEDSVPVLTAGPGPGTALALVRGGVPAVPAETTGTVGADLRAVEVDRVRRIVHYELLVANTTAHPVLVTAYDATLRTTAGPSGLRVTVPPQTSLTVALEVPFAERGCEQRVRAEIHSEHTMLTREASPPKEPLRRRLRVYALPTLAAGLVAAGIVAYGWERPRIEAFSVQPAAVSGTTLPAAFAVSGVGQVRYTVETPDGDVLQRGTVRGHAGVFSVALPPARKKRSVDVILTQAGVLGFDRRVARIVAAPTPVHAVAPHAEILSFSVASETVKSGASIAAAYHVRANSATITLLDQSGKIRATAIAGPRGRAVLAAPEVPVDQDLRVVLHARTGTSATQSILAVHVLATPAPDPAAAFSLPRPPGGVDADGAPFTIPVPVIVSGGQIPVLVLRENAKLHLSLATEAGTEISAVDVTPGESAVLLNAPTVSQPTKYMLVGTFPNGTGQDVVMKSFTVAPHVPRAAPARPPESAPR